MNRRMMIIIGGVLVVAIAGGGYFLAPSLLGGDAAAAAEAAVEEHEPTPGSGVIVEMLERIVNLSPGGGKEFAKIQFALEFDVELEEGGGHGGDPAKAFAEEVNKVVAVLEDRINSLMNSRTSTDLQTTEGKQDLKAEVLTYANELFGEEKPVTFVYIRQFVMQ